MTRTPEQVRKLLRFKSKQGLTKEVLGFAAFMLRQRARLFGKSVVDPTFGVELPPLGPRDMVKAAVLTGSSIMRGSIALDTALARWPYDIPQPTGYETETLAEPPEPARLRDVRRVDVLEREFSPQGPAVE